MQNYRIIYRGLVKLLILVGIGFASFPFISSLSTSDKTDDSEWSTYDVGNMQNGTLKKFPRVWIYKRKLKDKQDILQFTGLLQDPDSTSDRQPEAARNTWRSVNEEFFIFLPWTSRAIVRFGGEEKYSNTAGLIAEILHDKTYFWEPLDKRVWDTSGRVFRHDGYPHEQNLRVPEVKWKSKNQVMVYNRGM